MADEEWSSESSEVTTISTWHAGTTKPMTLSEFKPTFTYSIFGDEESIFGYKNLQIRVDFAAHDLRSNISWSYDKVFKDVGETKALDLEYTLSDFVPEGSFETRDKFMSRIQDHDASSFQPPGEKMRAWTKNGRQYEIWAAPLTDPMTKIILNRAQILISFFIEGGTHIETEDQDWTIARWRVFFVYEKLAKVPSARSSVYSLIGYSTSYRFLTFPKIEQAKTTESNDFGLPSTASLDVLSLPYRGRISQFLILPPHAHQGHGSILYATMFKYFLDDPACVEINIEDPNEAMDDLRDYCDFTHLLQNGSLEKIRLNHNLDPRLTQNGAGRRVPVDKLVDKSLLSTIRRENKLVARQLSRLVELWLLSRIPSVSRQVGTARLTKRAKTIDEGDRAMYFWRLLVKTRIYKQNRDKLLELEQSDIISHLEETTNNIVQDYERLLEKLAQLALKGAANDVDEAGPSSSKLTRRGKRNLIVDDDDDDDDDADVESRSKRQRSTLPGA